MVAGLIVRLGVSAFVACLAAPAPAQIAISGRVVDETGAGVPQARITLRPAQSGPAPELFNAVSDPTGAFTLELAAPARYIAEVECDGYFPLKDHAIQIDPQTAEIRLTLNHVREVVEHMNVSEPTNTVDIDNTAAERKLTGVEIMDIPYTPTRDLRAALPLIPGVVQDSTGDLHFDGGAESQTLYLLDGFDFSDPLTGKLDARLSVEAVRVIDWSSGRYSPEFGKGSGGALSIQTDMGDDPWRYSATNFIPGVDTQGGLHLGDWAPRVNWSGPIKPGRIWFSEHLDANYNQPVVPDLKGQNRTQFFQTDNLLRTQVNLKPSNILFADFLANYTFAPLTGLDALDPVSTTTDRRSRTWFFSARDQIYLTHRMLLEIGYAEDRNFFRVVPQGSEFYDVSPLGKSGNYYADSTQTAHRGQFLSNLFLPSFEFLGHHQWKTGVDLDRLNYWQDFRRTGIDIYDTTGDLVRQTVFGGNGEFSRPSFEASWYVMDDWKIRRDVTVQAGVRQDWDELLDRAALSPRVSVSWAPLGSTNTKISAGYAVVRDATSLQLFAQARDQYAVDTFFDPAAPPVVRMYEIPDARLLFPLYRNWTAALERRLPRKILLNLTAIRKRGSDGLAYTPADTPGLFDLTNSRRDSYDAAEISVQQRFGERYEWMASYTRSRAWSNEVLAQSVDQPLEVLNNAGRVAWDAPNRFVSWAYLPTKWKNWAVAYSVEARTGFPFSLVDNTGQIAGAADSQRFPMFLSLNVHPEYKFTLFGRRWALRGGFNNITNHRNPTVAETIPGQPVQLFGSEGRHFVFRIRWLGKQG